MTDLLDKINDSVLSILSLLMAAIVFPFEIARRWPGVGVLVAVLLVAACVILQVLGFGK